MSIQTPYSNGQVQVYTGNIVIVSMLIPSNPNPNAKITNGQQVYYVGLGQSATISMDAGLQANSGIGDNRVQQYSPGLATVSVSLTDTALRFNGVKSQSYESLGIAPQELLDLLGMNTFSIEIMDRPTGSVLRRVSNCLYQNGTLNVSAHNPVTWDVTFQGTETSGSFAIS